MKKLKTVSLLLAFISCAFLVYVQLSYQRTFEVPATGLKSSTDSTIIARGKYLAMGPAHCWTCHVEDPSKVDLQSAYPAMTGGHKFDLPFGTLYSPNITSDSVTGIGRYSDEQLAQIIRYNLKPSKQALAPFMTFNTMSDEDVVAIISYLRSTEPVQHKVPENDLNMLGKIVFRFLINPIIPEENQMLQVTEPDTTAEYGKYLVYSVTSCNGCHTERGPTGEFIGMPFAGGGSKEMARGTFVAPNLTPDPETGRIYYWKEQDFINRFRAGKIYQEEFMPWESYSLLSDNDLKAIYKFLRTLEPVPNKIEATFIPKESK